jgi:hypothetical protein
VFDTSFIAQNEKDLIGDRKITAEEELKQKASIALVNLWFENNSMRVKRQQKVDPW